MSRNEAILWDALADLVSSIKHDSPESISSDVDSKLVHAEKVLANIERNADPVKEGK